MSSPRKLVLCVIDAMAPSMLERAVVTGAAPVLATLLERGRYVPDCVSAFPSVTPVCAASIVTGAGPDAHHIPAMNWFHREEHRYVEYGSSFRAAQRFGIARQLTDTVYNMNRAHLSPLTPTVFEALDDAGVRTAGTTYLMYRGRHRHEPQRDSALTRFAATLMRHPVMGPRELFYADIFASRRAPCRAALGMPGVRDRHSGCVGAFLVEHALFDFLLLSLPDNDWLSHKHGPESQLRSLAQADLQLARVFDAAGGVEAFLEEHAVIVMADHSQVPISRAIALQDELAELGVLGPARPSARAPAGASSASGGASARRSSAGAGARIAVCPSQRAAMVYALHEQERDAMRASVTARALAIEGVELVAWLERDARERPREAVVSSSLHGELRFAPGGELKDARGARWSVEGALAVLDASARDGSLRTPAYPDALARLWSALTSPTAGEVLLSAADGVEFLDWGRQAHVGGGSHGSLHASDSLAPLILCGVEPAAVPAQWTIRDVASLVLGHFGLAP
jgi:Type I phosphodiesterase / nucleotide pyrophosphatase